MLRIEIRPLKVENRDGFEKHFGGKTCILEIGEAIGCEYEERILEDG